MDRLLVRPSETLHFIRNGTNPRVWWSEWEIRLGIIPSSSALPVPPLLLLQSRGPSRQMGIPQFLIPTAATATLFIRCRGHLSCPTSWIKEYIRAATRRRKEQRNVRWRRCWCWGIWSKAKLEIITPEPPFVPNQEDDDEGDHYTLIIIDRNTIKPPLPIARHHRCLGIDCPGWMDGWTGDQVVL